MGRLAFPRVSTSPAQEALEGRVPQVCEQSLLEGKQINFKGPCKCITIGISDEDDDLLLASVAQTRLSWSSTCSGVGRSREGLCTHHLIFLPGPGELGAMAVLMWWWTVARWLDIWPEAILQVRLQVGWGPGLGR